jgi:hypothetical protein
VRRCSRNPGTGRRASAPISLRDASAPGCDQQRGAVRVR